MNELYMAMKAETLKHVVGVLEAVDTEGLLRIEPDGVTCRIIDPANAQLTTVTIPAKACAKYEASGSFRAAIDIDWLHEVLDVTPDGSAVEVVVGDAEISLNVGIHQPARNLLNAERVRKVSTTPPESYYRVRADVPGAFLKQMVDYLKVIKADGVQLKAGKHNLKFTPIWNMDDGLKHYNAEADWITDWRGDVVSRYSLYYLEDIAERLPDSTVALRFGNDTPVMVRYGVGGCQIEHILAPRIESD